MRRGRLMRGVEGYIYVRAMWGEVCGLPADAILEVYGMSGGAGVVYRRADWGGRTCVVGVPLSVQDARSQLNRAMVEAYS